MKNFFVALLGVLMLAEGAFANTNEGNTDEGNTSNGWEGLYVGTLLSASNINSSHLTDHTYGSFSLPVTKTTSGHATNLGIVAGYNVSYHPYVIGAEADYNPTQHAGQTCRGATSTPNVCDNWVGHSRIASQIKYQGSLRLRGGYQANQYFAYVTAGMALMRSKNNLNVVCPNGCSTTDADRFLVTSQSQKTKHDRF